MKRRLDSLEPVDFTVNVPNPNVPIPQALSDEDKWMYLIHQAEIQTLLSLESEYEYHWKDHVQFGGHVMGTPCGPIVGSKKYRMRKLAPAPALTVPPTIAKYQSTEDIVRSAFHATLTANREADQQNIP